MLKPDTRHWADDIDWSRPDPKPSLPEALPTPRIIVPEHDVEPDELPRGPKAVAAVVSDSWFTRWTHSEAEVLTKPKRGGKAWGVVFAHETDGRHGWAAWNHGYNGGFLWRRGSIVPVKLSAAELKEVLAHG